MINKYILGAVLLGLTCTFTACFLESAMFDENQKIAENNWKQNDIKHFVVEINDSVSPHDLFFNVRNAGGYPYSNLFLFLKTTLPDGSFSLDTAECTLADPSGKWLGSGLGDIFDNRILFRKKFVFPRKGKYSFDIQQAMRIDPLPMIMDVGIRIEKSEDKW